MFGTLRFNRLIRLSLPLAALLGLIAPVAAGAVALGPKRGGPLSPDLRRLGAPSLSSQSEARQAAALGLPEAGPGSLIREGGRVLVDIRFDGGTLAHLDAVRGLGGRIASVSHRYGTVTAAVPPAALRELAGVADVGSVTAVPAPIVFAEEGCEGGSVISEGVAQINAKAAREEFGLDGEGVTVGVLSDSFDTASGVATDAKDDVETEDLPGLANECLDQKTPVDVLKDLGPSEEGGDEGRAMLQIVHDVAPAAKLAFATAFLGETAFAESIEELADPVPFGAGAKVIADDVAYLEEPFFQDGPIAAAVNEVTAEGVTYLSAAGNDNLVDSTGRDIASWEAPSFRDAGSCPAAIQGLSGFNGTHCMDFAPGATAADTTFGITVAPEETLLLGLQWAEPWFGVGTDLDAFLLNASGTQVLEAAFEGNPTDTEKPSELLGWTNGSSFSRTVQLAINRFSGGNPRLKFILFQNGGGVTGIEYPFSSGGDVVGPSVFGHAGGVGAIGVGAIPFNSTTKPESYSSRGPVTHYFAEVNGTTPAAPLGSAQVIPKPDVTATDCGATTFFAFKEGATWRFCGTSAAAPHAAGAVALMLQAGEEAGGGLEEPGPLRAALLQSASPIGSFGPCAIGAGLVETKGAVEALLAGPEPLTPPACEPPLSPPIEEPNPPAPTPIGNTTTPLPTPTVPASTVPRTSISKHPRKLVRTRSNTARVVFGFSSDQAGVTFRCRIDKAALRTCGSRIVRRFRLGRHVVKVAAVNSAGLADSTPAVFRFRVKHVP